MEEFGVIGTQEFEKQPLEMKFKTSWKTTPPFKAIPWNTPQINPRTTERSQHVTGWTWTPLSF
jgi:hypothetical protein